MLADSDRAATSENGNLVIARCVHYKIRENGRYITKAVYTLLALTVEGKKELLGLYLSEQEGAHHWLAVLTGNPPNFGMSQK